MHECLDLELDGLAHDGRGIGHLKDPQKPGERGLAVFVTGGLPGELVRCRVTARKPRLLEAELVAVLRPRADESPALCPHARAGGASPACGGCPLQTMPYERQLEWKARLAREALLRIGRLDARSFDAAWTGILPSPGLSGFRNRMTFAFGMDGGRLALGQRARGGAAVVDTPACALLPEGARELLAAARVAAEESGLGPWRAPERRRGRATGLHGFWRFLSLRQGWLPGETAPRWWALCLTSPGGPAERAAVRALGERLLSVGGAGRMGGFIHEERGHNDALAGGERRVLCLDAQGAENPDAALLRLPLAKRGFALDAASFFQVNTGAAGLLARTVMEMAPEAEGRGLLDVYCGVGAPGQLLAPNFASTLGLESDQRAVALAERNARDAGLTGCRYVAGDAGALLRRLEDQGTLPGLLGAGQLPPWDMALVDPPRGGLTRAALETLLRLGPRYLLYVSCNPATLARDAAALSQRYALERLTAVDLFPHTPHLECCSLWRLAHS